jgi:medium-chain acyl-[acyl-carrier-protein] hydrolase
VIYLTEKYTASIRLSSYDLDTSRRLKPSVLLKYLSDVAGRHIEEDGLTYDLMRENGFVFLLTKIAVKVFDFAKHNDEILIETWCQDTIGVQFIRNYRVRDKKGRILVEVQSTWVLVNPDTHKILRPSVFPLELVKCGDTVEAVNTKIVIPENIAPVGSRVVRWSDIDYNNHLNNAIYADIICDFFPDGMYEKRLKEFQIVFLNEALLSDIIHIFTFTEADGTAIFRGITNGKICFEARARAESILY